MKKIKPHAAFKTVRADEVAECWNGVPEALYVTLWNDVVPHQAPIANREDSGPHDHVGHANLASHWHRLTVEDQKLLNELAAKNETV